MLLWVTQQLGLGISRFLFQGRKKGKDTAQKPRTEGEVVKMKSHVPVGARISLSLLEWGIRPFQREKLQLRQQNHAAAIILFLWRQLLKLVSKCKS